MNLIINGYLATKIHIWVKFGDDWLYGAICILLTTFTRTDRPTDRQKNETAIGDCVLALISQNQDRTDDENDDSIKD